MPKVVHYILLCFLLVAIGCDHGLAPPDPGSKKTGISGTITFANWPPDTALYDLRLVAFNNFPPDDIITEIMEGEATVYPPITEGSIPFYIDSFEYLMELQPCTIGYLMVAHQYRPVFLDTNSWQAVGQYDTTSSDYLPTAIIIEAGKLLIDIDIDVDFNRLPLQPFKR
jgi:hypothetical protein